MGEFSQQLLHWFHNNGRRDLPWQRDPSPYRVWISEIMLQQTQVTIVIPYYQRFMMRFPNIESLAHAHIDDVLHLWAGLGYYARGRNLHRAAKIICMQHNGSMPEDISLLINLPGIGRSTAGAILALACDQRHPILDGNVKRILTRYHGIPGWPGKAKVMQQLWEVADQHTPDENIANYTQAIMDLGATVCIRRNPRCEVCPINNGCFARQQHKQSEFPYSKPSKSLPVRRAVFLMIQNSKGKILLIKRPPCGIWGGLWAFPECAPDVDIREWVRENLDYSIDKIHTKPIIRHTFSHFHLDIIPVYIPLSGNKGQVRDESSTWYQTGTDQVVGVPKPVKRLVEELNESNRAVRKTE